MSKKSLFEEALADAKAVKNTALELAKQTLEEHFTPKLKKMVDSKLQEGLEEEFEEDDDTSDEVKETKKPSEEEKRSSEEDKSGEDESINLEELLKELESEEDKSGEEVEESYGSEEKKAKPMDEKKSEEDSNEDGNEDIDEEKAQYLKLKEKFEPKKKSDEYQAPEEEKDVDEDIDVEALLRELEGGDEDEKKSEEEVEESKFGASEEDGEKAKPMDEDIKSLVAKLKSGASGAIEDFKRDYEALKDPKKREQWLQSLSTTMGRIQGVAEKKEPSEMEQIKSELNEAKLLNARLLYFGKLVKENEGLNKNDKLNLLRQLDKCTDVKQAKLVYETISGSLKAGKKSNTAKKQIKESMSFASKAAGTSTANKNSLREDKEIVNSDLTNRWKFLAFGQ